METWNEWMDKEHAMASDIQRYVDKKLEGHSKDFKIATYGAMIEMLSKMLRENVELSDVDTN